MFTYSHPFVFVGYGAGLGGDWFCVQPTSQCNVSSQVYRARVPELILLLLLVGHQGDIRVLGDLMGNESGSDVPYAPLSYPKWVADGGYVSGVMCIANRQAPDTGYRPVNPMKR